MKIQNLLSSLLPVVAMMFTGTAYADNYPLFIAGEQVTSENCADLSGIEGVSGIISYDPESKTLTLDNAAINSQEDCIEAEDKINIVVKGNVDLTTAFSNSILFIDDANISGNGTLNIFGSCGLLVMTNLTIEDCTINVKGQWGITGNDGSVESVIIRNASVTAEGSVGSISDIVSLTLDKCEIVKPVGAAFDASLLGVALDGELVKSQVEIKPTESGITLTEAETLPANLKGIYNLQGMLLGRSFDALPAGIYIVDGRKVIKK